MSERPSASRLTAEEQEQLDQAQAVLDQLAHLVHKINNPLTSLLGRAQLLSVKVGDDEKLRQTSDVIEQSARRINDHVREFSAVLKGARGANIGGPTKASSSD